jgi:hypothetical protein
MAAPNLWQTAALRRQRCAKQCVIPAYVQSIGVVPSALWRVRLVINAGLPTVQLSAKRAKAEEPSDDEDSGSARTTGRQRKRQVPLLQRRVACVLDCCWPL